jgi:glycosyltransferase 2 family protein
MRNRRLVAALRWAFLSAVVGVIVWQVSRQWDAVYAAAVAIGPGGIAGSLVVTLVGLGATGVAWRALLAGLGAALAPGAAAGIFFVAQLGKYLPGSVWPYVAQARIGRTHGVPASRSAAAGVLFVFLHCATGAIVAAVVLPLAGDETIRERFAWLPWLIPAFLIAVHPRAVHAGLSLAHRITRRGAAPGILPWRALAGALVAMVAAWGCYGAALFLLVGPLAGFTWHGAVLSTGGFALAWTVGFVAAAVLVVAAPAGLGVRELALYSVLAPVLSGGAATAVVVLSRVGQLAGDVIWAAVAAAWARRLVRNGPAATPDVADEPHGRAGTLT